MEVEVEENPSGLLLLLSGGEFTGLLNDVKLTGEPANDEAAAFADMAVTIAATMTTAIQRRLLGSLRTTPTSYAFWTTLMEARTGCGRHWERWIECCDWRRFDV